MLNRPSSLMFPARGKVSIWHMSPEDAEKAADQLLQAALEGGGRDNITLILMTDETGPVSSGNGNETGESSEENWQEGEES